LMLSQAMLSPGPVGPFQVQSSMLSPHLCSFQGSTFPPGAGMDPVLRWRASALPARPQDDLWRRATHGRRPCSVALADSPFDASLPETDAVQQQVACACQSLAAMIWSAARRSVAIQVCLSSVASLLLLFGVHVQANLLAASGLEGGFWMWRERATSGVAAAAVSMLLSLVHAIWCHGLTVAAVSLNLHALALSGKAPAGQAPADPEAQASGKGHADLTSFEALLTRCRKIEASCGIQSFIATSGALLAALGAMQVVALVGARALLQAPVIEFWLTNPALRIQVIVRWILHTLASFAWAFACWRHTQACLTRRNRMPGARPHRHRLQFRPSPLACWRSHAASLGSDTVSQRRIIGSKTGLNARQPRLSAKACAHRGAETLCRAQVLTRSQAMVSAHLMTCMKPPANTNGSALPNQFERGCDQGSTLGGVGWPVLAVAIFRPHLLVRARPSTACRQVAICCTACAVPRLIRAA